MQEQFNAYKKNSESQIKSLEIEILALKRQLTALTLESQKKYDDKGESSRSGDTSMVQVGEVQTRTIKMDFLVFTGEDLIGWIYKAYLFFSFNNTLPHHILRLASFHMDGKTLV